MIAKCPRCNSNDRIQKLSSIYASGKTTLHSANVGRITTETGLASRFEPPTPPGGELSIWYFLPILNFTMLFAPINIKYKILIFVGICYSSFSLVNASFAASQMSMIAYYIIYYMFAIKEAKARIIKEKMPHYTAKRIEWESAYYCHRDDIVFLP
jgi:hypothetical protein